MPGIEVPGTTVAGQFYQMLADPQFDTRQKVYANVAVTGEVLRFDSLSFPTFDTTGNLGCAGSAQMAFGRDGNSLYMVCADKIYKIDLAAWPAASPIIQVDPVADPGIAFTSIAVNGRFIAVGLTKTVGSTRTYAVRFYDLTGLKRAEVAVAKYPFWLLAHPTSNNGMYLVGQDELVTFDTKTGTPAATVITVPNFYMTRGYFLGSNNVLVVNNSNGPFDPAMGFFSTTFNAKQRPVTALKCTKVSAYPQMSNGGLAADPRLDRTTFGYRMPRPYYQEDPELVYFEYVGDTQPTTCANELEAWNYVGDGHGTGFTSFAVTP